MRLTGGPGYGLPDGQGFHFIINPASRNCPENLPEKILARYPRSEVCFTDGPGRAGPLAAGITAGGACAAVIVCGGDGTVREAAGAVGNKAVMGIIPVGTVNQVAKRLGIPGDPGKALSTLASRKVSDIYGGLCRFDGGEEQRFFIGVSMGPDADAVGTVDHSLKKRIGGAAYAISFLKRMADPVKTSITLTPKDGPEFKASQAIVLADGRYGGSMRFSGKLTLTEPKLAVAWTGGGRAAVLSMFISSLLSASSGARITPVGEGGIDVILPAPGHFQIDGDPIRAERAFIKPSLEPVRVLCP